MYLQELNSFHLDRLQHEPQMLNENKQQIQEEIKNLAFSNYKTFIRTAQCSREIYSDFTGIESKLDELTTKLPDFTLSCENFTKNIQSINASRRSNNLTLQKHNQILEILEISQLMDTCVRNEYYEEALDLAAYVRRLDKKFSSSIPIIQQIVDDCNKSFNLMLKQLLQQLKTNLQFNQCLKIIGLIRRLDVFTESELRFKFLQLRDSWLQSLLQSIPQNDPYNHISKTIEEYRIHLFDIITQYRAIFADDELITNGNTSTNNQEKIFGNFLNRDAAIESKLFYYWLQQKIKNFLYTLKKDLGLGVGTRLDSVLSQAMYFGLAFSRVGLDFRALMVPIFEEAILNKLKTVLQNGNSKFDESLSKLNWSELYFESSKKPFELSASQLSSNSSFSSSIINPPIQLLEFQPLAIYLNICLQYFNEFKLCAPLNLYSNFFNEIRVSVRKLGQSIVSYHKKEKLDKNESELFGKFLYQLAYSMIPFLEKCLSNLFPMSQMQKVYSINQADLEKFKQVLKLNSNELLSDLSELIPTPKQEEVVQSKIDNFDLARVTEEVEEKQTTKDLKAESAQIEEKTSNEAIENGQDSITEEVEQPAITNVNIQEEIATS
jgi:hypothetical protein